MRNKRRDAVRVREIDGNHALFPYIMPKRTEAEVSMREDFDVTNLVEYMKKRNEEEKANIKIFHAIATCVARTIYHRPLLNRFISGRTYYQRNDITLSFVAKQKFEDTAEERLMFIKVAPDMNIDKISKIIIGDVKKARKEKGNDIGGKVDFIGKFPRFLLKIVFAILNRLEYHGMMPKALTDGDPNYSTVLMSNLGSIGASSCYHHLSNYGTNSIMITIGTLHKEMRQMTDGTWQERDIIDCTFNIDERIADGFYFAKSLRIFKYLFENPECLEETIETTVPVEM